MSFDIFLDHYKEINEKLWGLYRQDLISKDELRSKRFDLTLNKYSIKDNELASKIGDTYVSKSPLQTSLFPYTKEVLSYLKKNPKDCELKEINGKLSLRSESAFEIQNVLDLFSNILKQKV